MTSIKAEKHQKRFFSLAMILLVVSTIVTVAAVGAIYFSALNIEKTRLRQLVSNQAQFISEIAKFDSLYHADYSPGGASAAALSQVLDAFAQRNTFRQTGEFVLGRKENGHISFLLKSRHLNKKISNISIMSDSAEPMRRALMGKNGVMIGNDYRPVSVIAAYAYIPELDLGLVAKIDIAEFRKPFVNTMIKASIVGILLFFLGTLLLRQIEENLLKKNTLDDFHSEHVQVSSREHLIYFIWILSVVSTTILITSVVLLYQSSYQAAQSSLVGLAKSETFLIRAVAKFDEKNALQEYKGTHRTASLSQIVKALHETQKFEHSTELELAERKGDNVVFLASSHDLIREIPSVHITEPKATSMQQALLGNSGVAEGTDYRGVNVLAAYQAIPELDAGFVVKMDTFEIARPFINVALVGFAVALMMIVSCGVALTKSKKYSLLFVNTKTIGTMFPSGFDLRTEQKTPLFLVVFITCLVIFILLLDFVTPLGIAGGVPYILVVLAGWWLPSRNHIFFLAVVCSVFTIVGCMISPWGLDVWVVLTNRTYAFAGIWAVALIISLGKTSQVERIRQTAELAKLSLAVEYSPSSVIITDLEGKIEYVNKKFESVTGYSCIDSIGQNLSMLKSGKTPDETYKQLWKTILSGQEWRGDLLNRKKNGDEYWESVAILPIRSPHGEMLHFLALREDISERKAAEEQLKHMANHDALTELPTRRLGLERLAGTIALARREKKMAAVLFVDLDGFKAVNDTLGHDAGDQLLIEVANRMLACVREIDTVARIGGDEFMCVLGGLENRENAEQVVKKIIKALALPFPIEDDVAQIGASIGISCFPDHATDPESLVKLADNAMYLVKKQGKNNFSWAEDL